MKIKEILNRYWAIIFVAIPIILQMIFFYFPMVQGAFYSLTNWTGLTYNFDFVGLNNYKILFSDPKFIKSIGFTLIVTLCMIAGQIGFGILIARALNANIKGKTFFRAWFFFPAVLSGVVVSLVFKQIFNYGLPTFPADEAGQSLTIGAGDLALSVSATSQHKEEGQGIAMPVIIFLAGFQSIPQEIIEAAVEGVIENTQDSPLSGLTELAFTDRHLVWLAKDWNSENDFYTFALTGGGPSDQKAMINALNAFFNPMKADGR
ncbi:multiple sugar-binding transport system permease protein MsmF (plasmid) [Enterococcus faecium]|nr:multiple sugar-binding transport system permease protein MsmF [Enterococcus faecium]